MLLLLSVFILVVVLHEVAHGLVAYLLGDPTARNSGKLTLNPLAHIDPIGSVILPLVLVLSHSPIVFGWAKPVPINPFYFKNRRIGMLLTSSAGPAANFIIAAIFALLYKTGWFLPYLFLKSFLLAGVLVSLVLGVFNLIPIPPLDGSRVLFSLLPARALKYMLWLERYGFLILLALLYFGAIDKILTPTVQKLYAFLMR